MNAPRIGNQHGLALFDKSVGSRMGLECLGNHALTSYLARKTSSVTKAVLTSNDQHSDLTQKNVQHSTSRQGKISRKNAPQQ
jgi:hypothetical protein